MGSTGRLRLMRLIRRRGRGARRPFPSRRNSGARVHRERTQAHLCMRDPGGLADNGALRARDAGRAVASRRKEPRQASAQVSPPIPSLPLGHGSFLFASLGAAEPLQLKQIRSKGGAALGRHPEWMLALPCSEAPFPPLPSGMVLRTPRATAKTQQASQPRGGASPFLFRGERSSPRMVVSLRLEA